MTKKCSACSSENPETAKFCLECGAVLAQSTQSTVSGASSINAKNGRCWKKIFGAGVLLVLLVVAGVWAKDSMEVSNLAEAHNVQGLNAIIQNDKTRMWQKEMALETLIKTKDEQVLYLIEEGLKRNYPVDAKILVWKYLSKEKIKLPSGVAILAEVSDAAKCQEAWSQYYKTLFSPEEFQVALHQRAALLTQTSNVDKLDTLLKNSESLLTLVTTEEQGTLAKIKSEVDLWKSAAWKEKELAGQIEQKEKALQEKKQSSNGVLSELHNHVMHMYIAKNSRPIYDPNMRAMVEDSFRQTDSLLKMTVENLAGKNDGRKIDIYLNIASEMGDPEGMRQAVAIASRFESSSTLAPLVTEINGLKQEKQKTLTSVKECRNNILSLLGSTGDALPAQAVVTSGSGYKNYTNPRFGYSISYPADFEVAANPANGDGMRFASPDKQAVLSVYGGNLLNRTAQDMFEVSKKSIKGELGYNVLESDWFVLTWKENGTLYYKKDLVGSKAHNGFTFSFPESMRGQYEPVIEEIEKSFKRGNTEQGH